MIVSWMTTNKCNLTCKHCYQDAGENKSAELTTAEALKLIDECERLIPETANKASVTHARSLILFLQGRYSECKNIAKQVLLYTPNAMAVRLIMIACCYKMGQKSECEAQIKKLYENHPSFNQNDIEQLLAGVTPQKKAFIMESLQEIFKK